MKIWRRFIVAGLAPVLLWSGAALAQGSSPPGQSSKSPQTVSGQVVRIDRAQQRVTIKTADGTVHEFQASKETLQDLKEGDRIEARLRQ
jgi:hypothetical protein